MTKPLFIAALALMAGCSTTPVSSRDATPIAASKHLLFKEPSKITAPVLVIRDSGLNTSACDTKFTVNGQLAAYLGTSEKVMLHIPAGEHILGVEASGICAGGLNERQANLVAGKPAYFRIGYDNSGSLGLHPTIAR